MHPPQHSTLWCSTHQLNLALLPNVSNVLEQHDPAGRTKWMSPVMHANHQTHRPRFSSNTHLDFFCTRLLASTVTVALRETTAGRLRETTAELVACMVACIFPSCRKSSATLGATMHGGVTTGGGEQGPCGPAVAPNLHQPAAALCPRHIHLPAQHTPVPAKFRPRPQAQLVLLQGAKSQ